MAGDIEAMFHLSGYDPPRAIERIVPDGSINIVIELDGQERFVVPADESASEQRCVASWISGVHQRPISIRVPNGSELIAIRFATGRAHPFLGVPLSELTDKVIPARDVVGDSIATIRNQAIAAADSSEKLSLVADWLEAQKSTEHIPPPALTTAVDQIRARPTVATLADLHSDVGVSSTHLVTLFRRYVGVRPKQLQRILRFASVFATLSAEGSSPNTIDWSRVSVDCGYYDQSHLIRDFSHFSGFRPSEFLDRGDNRLNFFPIEE